MTVQLFERFFNIAARAQILRSSGAGFVEGGVEGGQDTLVFENLTGDETRMTWTVSKANFGTEYELELKIFNPSKANVGKLEKIQSLLTVPEVFQINFFFGWSGKVSKNFSGQIYKVKTQERIGADVVSVISAGANTLNKRNSLPLGYELSQGVYLEAFKVIARSLGVRLSNQFIEAINSNSIATTYATLSAVLDSDPESNLDTLVSELGPSYDWVIEGGLLYLLNGGLFQDETPPQILQPSSGLLLYTPQEDGGLEITALGNPIIRPGQQILVNGSNGERVGGGPLRVERIDWVGDTIQGCEMIISARKPNPFA